MLEFENAFEALTGVPPLSWQRRLYRKHFASGSLPSVVDIPTGMGKTMIMAIWLIARANKCKAPTRLIYVVDRRTVVDQATDVAESLVKNWTKSGKFDGPLPAISTLRGQLADNREWSRDPSRPAIIIGTVDLIGSGLLFSGYRSGFKSKPLHAGLLGQDSMLVLDEAHLSKPFEKLLLGISSFQQSHGSPMQVIRMSATSGKPDDGASHFTLDLDATGNLTGEDAADPVIAKRYSAQKRLKVITVKEKEKLNAALAESAIELAKRSDLVGKRIVVFVRKPADATAVADLIRKHVIETVDDSGPKPKKIKNTPYAESAEVLTGTMRGLERDRLVKTATLMRFLDGDEVPGKNNNPVFLISTSAGEVGFDLNADHMVCDATTIDSFIQRLGRVNRRGNGAATVKLVRGPVKLKDGKPEELKGLDLAIANTLKLLEGIPDGDVSPRNIAALRSGSWKDEYNNASSPESATVELTDILLDNWSMTSIDERMPGRPPVGPWLRGIEEERAQTTVAWRAELDLFDDLLTAQAPLAAIFAKHAIRPHESLTVNTAYLVDFLKAIPKLKDRPPNLMSTVVAIRLPFGKVDCQQLNQLVKNPSILYADSTLILPATFGGLDGAGMLDAEAIPKQRAEGDTEPPSLDVADHEDYKQNGVARSRLRILMRRTGDRAWTVEPLPALSIPDYITLEPEYENSSSLFKAIRDAELRVRLVRPVAFDDEGDPACSLVCLAPALKTQDATEDQILDVHVGLVKKEAEDIAKALKLPEDDVIWIALMFAAQWHDEGKKAPIWQRFAKNPDPHEPPLGKMVQSRDPKSLRGYRHEFGSLLRMKHPDRCNTKGCEAPKLADAHELALHLIATHHGAGRPHFRPALYEPFTDAETDAVHTDVIRRFARLQRKYGWWRLAWLENLLRCADALASAQAGSSGDEDEMEVEE